MPTATIPNRPAGTPGPRQVSDLLADFDAITAFLNGATMDANNFSDSFVNRKLGLSTSSKVRRGFAQVATTQSTSSTTRTDLTTPGPSITLDSEVTFQLVKILVVADFSVTSGGTGTISLYDGGVDAGDLIAQSLASTTTVYTGGPSSGVTLGTIAKTQSRMLWYRMLIPTSPPRTLKLMYRVNGGLGTWGNRKMWVEMIDPNTL